LQPILKIFIDRNLAEKFGVQTPDETARESRLSRQSGKEANHDQKDEGQKVHERYLSNRLDRKNLGDRRRESVRHLQCFIDDGDQYDDRNQENDAAKHGCFDEVHSSSPLAGYADRPALRKQAQVTHQTMLPDRGPC
jgi:hypothetical protein